MSPRGFPCSDAVHVRLTYSYGEPCSFDNILICVLRSYVLGITHTSGVFQTCNPPFPPRTARSTAVLLVVQLSHFLQETARIPAEAATAAVG